MITTKSVGIGEETANPKPVRHVNWFGQPMNEGDNYWGESVAKEETATAESTSVVRTSRPRKAKRNPKAWSAEARAAYSQRMKDWWKAKKEQSTTKQGET